MLDIPLACLITGAIVVMYAPGDLSDTRLLGLLVLGGLLIASALSIRLSIRAHSRKKDEGDRYSPDHNGRISRLLHEEDPTAPEDRSTRSTRR
jgi:hypothetical protein